MALGLVPSLQAFAGCDTPYTTDGLLEDLVTVENFMRGGDNDAAGKAATKLEAGLACLNETIPPVVVGRTYRAVAGGLFVGGKTDEGKAWYRTATEIEQNFHYGIQDVAEDHPVRAAMDEARAQSSTEEIELDGRGFVEGKHYLDGRKISTPKARAERPHIYQVDLGEGVQTFLIQGNAFPEDVLTGGALADAGGKKKKVKEPKEKKSKTSVNEEGFIERQRPWEKTPLMIGGGAIILGAGGVYILSGQARKRFDDGTTAPQIADAKRETNQLVLMSAAVLAAGAGTLTWGVILDGGTPIPGLHMRF